MPATVRMVEQLGHETLLICDAAGTRVVVRQDAEAVAPPIGAEVKLDAAEPYRHRFDPVDADAGGCRMKRKWRDMPVAVGMLAPSAVILGVFVVYPLVRAIQLGHLRCDATGKRCREGGWGQYVDVFRSHEFQHALANNIRLALMTVPIGLAFGVGLAVLADKQIRGVGFFRTVFSSTVATSVAVASLVWFVLLQPQVGVLPDLFHGTDPIAEAAGSAAGPGTALPAVALSSIWASLGFTFIVMTAALQGIPASCTRARSSTARAGGCASPTSRSRCSARRSCSHRWC